MTEKLYTYPYGIWEVTTEGDCEGHTTTKLGIFEGFIDDIAFALADKVFYKLTFKQVGPPLKALPCTIPTKKSVRVAMDIDSGTWGMDPEGRVAWWRKFLKNRNVTTKPSTHFASVELWTPHTTMDEIRNKTLARLTPEERMSLGYD